MSLDVLHHHLHIVVLVFDVHQPMKSSNHLIKCPDIKAYLHAMTQHSLTHTYVYPVTMETWGTTEEYMLHTIMFESEVKGQMSWKMFDQ